MNHKEIERWRRLTLIKKATQGFIAIILAVSAAVYVWSWFSAGPGQDNEAPKGVSGTKIEKFIYSNPGPQPWELEAASADISDSLDRAVIQSLRVVYHGGQGGEIVMRADSGELDKKTGSIRVSGNVLIQFRDFSVRVDDVIYSDEKRSAVSDSKVELQSRDLRITGKGLKVSIDREEVEIERDVRTQLHNLKLVEQGGKLPM